MQDEIDRANKKLFLLEQVPCGDKFPSCKFISSAHQSLSQVSLLTEKKGEKERASQALHGDIDALEPPKVQEYLNQYEQVLTKRKAKQEEVNKHELEVAKNKTTIVRLRDSKNESEQKIRLFEENEKVITEFAKLTRIRNESVLEKKKLKDKLTVCEKEMIELSKKQGNWESTLREIEQDEFELQKAQKDYSAYDLYKKAMGSNGVSLDIIKKELPVINDEIAKILANVVNFEVFLENDERRLNVLIKHPKFDARPLEMGSGAEKAIAAMAIRLAFINVSSLPIGDVFILDEPGTALDEENMEGFIRILDLVKSHFKNVILISHLDSLKDSVDLQISIEKKDKFAFVNQ